MNFLNTLLWSVSLYSFKVVHEHSSDDPENVKCNDSFPNWNTFREHLLKYFPADVSSFKPKRVKDSQDMFYPLIKTLSISFLLSTSNMFTNSRHWSVGFQNPYFHVFIIDARAYNETLKRKLSEWVKDMREKHYHYLIICVPSPSSIKKSSLLQKAYVIDKVFDAIKKDFGSDDRVMRLTHHENLKSLVSNDFSEIAYRITDEVMHEFVKRKKRIDREIKRFEDTKNLPGWNYSHYFMLKENSAVNFQMIGLVRAALNVYNDALKFRRNEGIVIETYIKSQQMNTIFDCNAKIFRTMLYDSSITEFEFQNYCFARMVNLMIKQSTPEEAAELALEFIPNTTTKLKKSVSDLFFIYCWTYCTTMQIVDECKKNAFETLLLEKYFRTLGDLYSYAKYALKLAKKHYINTMSKKSPLEQNLIHVISNDKEYEKLIIEISSAASNGYMSGKRPRFLAKNNNEISQLRIKDGKYEETLNLLRNHLMTYMKEGWDVLAIDVLQKMAKCQLQQNLIGDFISSTISLIVRDAKVDHYQFLDAISKLSKVSRLEVLTKLFHPTFVIPTMKCVLGDTINIQIKFASKIDLVLDSVSLHFACGDAEWIVSSDKFEMKSICGLTLTKRVDLVGDLVLNKIIYRYEKLEFVELVKNGMNLLVKDFPPVVDVELESEAFVVGKKQYLKLHINIKGMLTSGRLHLFSPTSLEIYDREKQFEAMENRSIPISISVLANGMINTRHTINLTFLLSGHGKSPIKFEKTFLVDFYMPFTHVTTVKHFNQQTFVQYRLKCNTPFPISIIKTSLNSTCNIALEPQEYCSFVANLDKKYLNHSLMIWTRVGNQTLSYKMDQKWNEQQVSFAVDFKIPDETIVVGNSYTCEYIVQNLGNDRKVLCEIIGKNWMIQGTVKKEISLEKDQEYRGSCVIIPLSCGNVLIPSIKIVGLDKEGVLIKNSKNRILILPESEVSIGGCVNFVPTTAQ